MRAPSPIALVLSFVFGCSGVSVDETATVSTQPGEDGVRLAALDGCCAILGVAPARGQIDVFTPRAREIGSFTSGSASPRDVLVASVGGRPALLVRGEEREVSLITNDLVDPHRLRRPNPIYGGDNVAAIAVGDLDGDGMDELVVADGGRVRYVNGLEQALFVDPEHVPDLDVSDLPNGAEVSAMAVADITGDGQPDVVGALRSQTAARVWDAPGYDRSNESRTFDLDLGGTALELVATRCDGGAVFARLEDGHVVRVHGALATDATEELPVMPNAIRLVTSSDALAIVHDDGTVEILDACGREGGAVDTGSAILDLAITRRLPGGRRMAVLRDDGQTIALYDVGAGF